MNFPWISGFVVWCPKICLGWPIGLLEGALSGIGAPSRKTWKKATKSDVSTYLTCFGIEAKHSKFG